MNTNIKATSIELTSDVRAYLDKRLAAVADFVDTQTDAAVCDVEVGRITKGQRHGEIYRAEINIEVEGVFFRAESEKETLYAAIDKAKDDVLRELRRHKRKQVHLLRRGGARFKEITQTLSVRGARLRGYVERYRRRRKGK